MTINKVVTTPSKKKIKKKKKNKTNLPRRGALKTTTGLRIDDDEKQGVVGGRLAGYGKEVFFCVPLDGQAVGVVIGQAGETKTAKYYKITINYK